MPSITDLCNEALRLVGQDRITSINDGSVNANTCKLFYATSRDAVLRDNNWGFAKKRLELAETTTPVFGWNYAFGLPADNIRVIRLGTSDDIKWAIEGKTLVTDESTASILYIFRVTDVNKWDSLFYQALSVFLASKLAMPLTENEKKMTELLKAYDILKFDAEAVDGQEGVGGSMPSPTLTDDVRE